MRRAMQFPCKFRPCISMGPRSSSPRTEALFINRLDELLDLKHALVRLAGLIDWSELERNFAVSFPSGRSRPALPPAGCWLALSAAHLRCLGRSRRQYLDREPVLAVLLWLGVPADQTASCGSEAVSRAMPIRSNGPRFKLNCSGRTIETSHRKETYVGRTTFNSSQGKSRNHRQNQQVMDCRTRIR